MLILQLKLRTFMRSKVLVMGNCNNKSKYLYLGKVEVFSTIRFKIIGNKNNCNNKLASLVF